MSSSSFLLEFIGLTLLSLQLLYDELVHDLFKANGFDKTHFRIIITHNSESFEFSKFDVFLLLARSIYESMIHKNESKIVKAILSSIIFLSLFFLEKI